MPYQVEVIYSREFLAALVKTDWREQHLKGYLFYLSIPTIALFTMLAIEESPFDGFNGFFTGCCVGILATLLLFMLWSYQEVRRQNQYVVESGQYEPIKVLYEFNEEGIQFQDDGSSGKYLWKSVTYLSQTSDYWQIYIRGQLGFSIPSESLEAEAQEFILQKLSKNEIEESSSEESSSNEPFHF